MHALLGKADSSPKKRKRQRKTAALEMAICRTKLYLLYVGSLISLGTLSDTEGNPLALVESFESISLDSAIMNENVLAIVAGYESITLRRVEPFYCALSCQSCSS